MIKEAFDLGTLSAIRDTMKGIDFPGLDRRVEQLGLSPPQDRLGEVGKYLRPAAKWGLPALGGSLLGLWLIGGNSNANAIDNLSAAAENLQEPGVNAIDFSHQHMPGLTTLPFPSGSPTYVHQAHTLVTPPEGKPSILAHELGHAITQDSSDATGTQRIEDYLFGRPQRSDAAAFSAAEAHKMPINEAYKEAIMAAHEKASRGVRAGGVIGGTIPTALMAYFRGKK
jgi:hypothetical protein